MLASVQRYKFTSYELAQYFIPSWPVIKIWFECKHLEQEYIGASSVPIFSYSQFSLCSEVWL